MINRLIDNRINPAFNFPTSLLLVRPPSSHHERGIVREQLKRRRPLATGRCNPVGVCVSSDAEGSGHVGGQYRSAAKREQGTAYQKAVAMLVGNTGVPQTESKGLHIRRQWPCWWAIQECRKQRARDCIPEGSGHVGGQYKSAANREQGTAYQKAVAMWVGNTRVPQTESKGLHTRRQWPCGWAIQECRKQRARDCIPEGSGHVGGQYQSAANREQGTAYQKAVAMWVGNTRVPQTESKGLHTRRQWPCGWAIPECRKQRARDCIPEGSGHVGGQYRSAANREQGTAYQKAVAMLVGNTRVPQTESKGLHTRRQWPCGWAIPECRKQRARDCIPEGSGHVGGQYRSAANREQGTACQT